MQRDAALWRGEGGRWHNPSRRTLSTERILKKIATSIKLGSVVPELAAQDPERVASLTSVLLAEAGVDVEAVAKVLARGLTAKKKVSLEETLFKDDGTPQLTTMGAALNIRRIHEVENDEVQQKTAATVLALLTPRTEGPTVGQMNIIIPQVPAEMLGLSGDAQQKYYVDRTRALALGQSPPPIENYRQKEVLDGLEEIVQPDSVAEGKTP